MGPAEYASGVARSPVWLEQSNQGGRVLENEIRGHRDRATSTENL